MQVTRVAGALGARIDGVDPRDPAAFDDIKAAVLEHEVVFFRGANLSEEEQFELGRRFGTPSIFVDDELRIPIRIEGYDWPQREGDQPRLLEEYTYTRLRLNVGLTDADFSPTVLEP